MSPIQPPRGPVRSSPLKHLALRRGSNGDILALNRRRSSAASASRAAMQMALANVAAGNSSADRAPPGFRHRARVQYARARKQLLVAAASTRATRRASVMMSQQQVLQQQQVQTMSGRRGASLPHPAASFNKTNYENEDGYETVTDDDEYDDDELDHDNHQEWQVNPLMLSASLPVIVEAPPLPPPAAPRTYDSQENRVAMPSLSVHIPEPATKQDMASPKSPSSMAASPAVSNASSDDNRPIGMLAPARRVSLAIIRARVAAAAASVAAANPTSNSPVASPGTVLGISRTTANAAHMDISQPPAISISDASPPPVDAAVRQERSAAFRALLSRRTRPQQVEQPLRADGVANAVFPPRSSSSTAMSLDRGLGAASTSRPPPPHSVAGPTDLTPYLPPGPRRHRSPSVPLLPFPSLNGPPKMSQTLPRSHPTAATPNGAPMRGRSHSSPGLLAGRRKKGVPPAIDTNLCAVAFAREFMPVRQVVPPKRANSEPMRGMAEAARRAGVSRLIAPGLIQPASGGSGGELVTSPGTMDEEDVSEIRVRATTLPPPRPSRDASTTLSRPTVPLPQQTPTLVHPATPMPQATPIPPHHAPVYSTPLTVLDAKRAKWMRRVLSFDGHALVCAYDARATGAHAAPAGSSAPPVIDWTVTVPDIVLLAVVNPPTTTGGAEEDEVAHQHGWANAFTVSTREGRDVVFRAGSDRERRNWLYVIGQALSQARHVSAAAPAMTIPRGITRDYHSPSSSSAAPHMGAPSAGVKVVAAAPEKKAAVIVQPHVGRTSDAARFSFASSLSLLR
ncbi:hypothetical protein BC828DRAFT_404982 [Blastocladiella britannica]|nr:hypothetical protein BC828DRAFT_404982 [Blastocladiella britannica]